MIRRLRVIRNDPYADWLQVYRGEIIDRIKHWPANRKAEMEGIDNINEGMEVVRS